MTRRRRLWVGVAACLFLGSQAATAANADVFSTGESEDRGELAITETPAAEDDGGDGVTVVDYREGETRHEDESPD